MIYSPYILAVALVVQASLRPISRWLFRRTSQRFVLTLRSLCKWSPCPSVRNWFDFSLPHLAASCLHWDSLLYKQNMKQAYNFYSDRAKAFSVIIL